MLLQDPLDQTEPPAIALRREHGREVGVQLSPAKRAALLTRLDTCPTKADWALYSRVLEVML